MKHTPTPWGAENDETITIRNTRDGGIIATLHHLRGRHGAFGRLPTEEVEANARFIVRAVNSHDDLVSALEECAAVCAGEITTKNGLIGALEKARAALKKAKE